VIADSEGRPISRGSIVARFGRLWIGRRPAGNRVTGMARPARVADRWAWVLPVCDILFPPVCVACGAIVEDSGYRYLCAACAGHIEFSAGPNGGLAPTAVVLRGPARALVHAYKYRGARHLRRDMSRIVQRAPWLLDHVRGAVLVPVPSHPRRERERGFNQSDQLARALARAAGGGTRVSPVLRRIRDTAPQAGLDRPSRLANLKNAFALAPHATLNLRLRHIIVDDVLTTGSTLQGCAQALREAGCVTLAAAFAQG